MRVWRSRLGCRCESLSHRAHRERDAARNSKGHIFVFTRSGETRLFEFDQNGVFVREIGQGLYGFEMAHGVRVDAQDNVWTVDEGTDVIVKFSPEGRVLMVMGRRRETVEGVEPTPPPGTPPPPAQPYRFRRPTDITWDPAGNIFVSDGYNNSRVVSGMENGEIYKMTLDGKVLGKFGTAGKLLKEFGTVHQMDCRSENELCVGEITNWRVQKLTLKPSQAN